MRSFKSISSSYKIGMYLFLLLPLFFPFFLASSQDQNSCQRNFYLVTVPKSGTHLMQKLLTMLTTKDRVYLGSGLHCKSQDEAKFENRLMSIKKSQKFPFAHFDVGQPLWYFSSAHPDWVPIVMVRDLRDVLVSAVYFMWKRLEQRLGPSTVEQKLLAVIQDYEGNQLKLQWDIHACAEEAIRWMNHPKAQIYHFEDLIGKEGGGSRIKQEKEIVRLATILNIPLNVDSLKYLTENLFGTKVMPSGSSKFTTFRKGQIGEWRHFFSEEHLRLFIKHWGALQVALGYQIES